MTSSATSQFSGGTVPVSQQVTSSARHPVSVVASVVVSLSMFFGTCPKLKRTDSVVSNGQVCEEWVYRVKRASRCSLDALSVWVKRVNR